MEGQKMNQCGSKKSNKAYESSLSELFLLNKSTYKALLSKISPLEKLEIDKLNAQTLIPADSDYDSPAPTEVTNLPENTAQATSEANSSMISRIESKMSGNDEQSEIGTSQASSSFDDGDVGDGDQEQTSTLVTPKDHQSISSTPPSSPPVSVVPTPKPQALEARSRKRKASHNFPHLVSLKTTPDVLVTKDDNSKEGNDIQPKPTEAKASKAKKETCPVCLDTYAGHFALFRHLTSMHPKSKEAKEVWRVKREKEQKNRKALALKQMALTKRKNFGRKHTLSKPAAVGSTAEESKVKPLQRKRKAGPDLSSTQSTKNVRRSPRNNKTQKEGLVDDDQQMKPKPLAAGVKRTRNPTLSNIKTKITKSVAPKRKLPKEALFSDTNRKRSKHRTSTTQRLSGHR